MKYFNTICIMIHMLVIAMFAIVVNITIAVAPNLMITCAEISSSCI